MDVGRVEALVATSLSNDEGRKAEAIRCLLELKANPDAIPIGIMLYMQSAASDVRLFGLTMIREHLIGGAAVRDDYVTTLRSTLFQLLSQELVSLTSSPFLLNNLLYLVSLCIKRDYPEQWPTAFTDLLSLARSTGWNGVDMMARIINELEVEVVIFHEDRSRDEIKHNTIIKDTMRTTSAIPEITCFLRDAVHASVVQGHIPIGSHCLLCLSQLIGWIDIKLVLTELYPILRTLLQENKTLQEESLACIFEIMKKGMDPVLKVELISQIEIIPILSSLLPRTKTALLYTTFDEDQEKIFDMHKKLGMVLDMMMKELLGCYLKYEEFVIPSKKPSFPSSSTAATTTAQNAAQHLGVSDIQQLQLITPIAVSLIHHLINDIIDILYHPLVTVAATVVPSLEKFITLLKTQKLKFSQHHIPTENACIWLGNEYFDRVLVAFLHQAQYPTDFRFDESEEEIDEEFIEGKFEIRRLLANLSRVYPQRFLQVISLFLTELPQPLSAAPVGSLDICLHILQAVDVTQNIHRALSNDDVIIQQQQVQSGVQQEGKEEFTALFTAIQQTDLRNHPDIHIQISYLEFSIRFLKLLLDDDQVINLAVSMLQSLQRHGQKLQSLYIKNMRTKLSSLALKLCEGSSSTQKMKLLLAIGQGVKAIILQNHEAYFTYLTSFADANTTPRTSANSTSNTALSFDGEVHLYEIVGLLSTHRSSITQQQYEQQQQLQWQLFNETIAFITQQLRQILPLYQAHHHTTHCGSKSMIEAYLAQQVRIYSALIDHLSRTPSATNNNTSANSTEVVQLQQYLPHLQQMTTVVAEILAALPQSQPHQSRGGGVTQSTQQQQGSVEGIKLRIFKFLHLILPFLHSASTTQEANLTYIYEALPYLLTTPDQPTFDLLIELLNQILIEFEEGALALLKVYFPWVVNTFMTQVQEAVAIQQQQQQQTGVTTNTTVGQELPQLIKQWLSLMQHVTLYHCEAILTLPISLESNETYLYFNLNWLLFTVKGFSPLETPIIPKMSALPLRRGAISVVLNLIQCWLTTTAFDEASSMFISFLTEMWLPAMFLICGSSPGQHPNLVAMIANYEQSKLNVQDAATQGILMEVAQLLFVLARHAASNSLQQQDLARQGVLSSATNYFHHLDTIMTRLAWSQEARSSLFSILSQQPDQPLGTFRELFKQFARRYLI